jgi:hypothetical protein
MQQDDRGPVRSHSPEVALLVSCSACGRLHAAADALAFDPVCPACARPHPMGMLGMSGSYPLTHGAIDDAVVSRVPGNFALGYEDGGTFLVFYVGRSDTDVRTRLHEWVGVPSRCPRFAPSAQAPWLLQGSGSVALHAPALASAGMGVDSSYTHFAYGYAGSPAAAFAKQCRNYEDFGGSHRLDNAAHPAETRVRGDLASPFRLRPAERTRVVGHAPRP